MEEDKFKAKDMLRDWVFWIGILIVLGGMALAFSQIWARVLEGAIWNWATALLCVGTIVTVMGVFHASSKANKKDSPVM